MTLFIGTPSGPHSSSCGYCSPPGERSIAKSSHHIAGLDAVGFSCDVYQRLIDRGWRRSGKWCYKPDLKATCCPQYTIKLDALEFKISKNQRKLLNKWNRFILQESQPVQSSKSKQRKNGGTFNLADTLHSSEAAFLDDSHIREHNFEVLLEPASYTAEKFQLYCKYQETIHSDFGNSPTGFKRFLIDTPLAPIGYTKQRPPHLPEHYGSYHQLYRLDGKLIAMAVLDILPSCVSSVYFMYDRDWERFSLGKISALREISLAREIHDCGVTDLKYLYLGFYIHTCQKMRYKAEYEPSYLADPETNAWFPMNQCRSILDKNRYACFSTPEHSLPPGSQVPAKEFLSQDPPDIEDDWLDQVQVIAEVKEGTAFVVPIHQSKEWRFPRLKREILWCIHGLGKELSSEVLFMF